MTGDAFGGTLACLDIDPGIDENLIKYTRRKQFYAIRSFRIKKARNKRVKHANY